MARVTVEDCVLKVPNRFDLVFLAPGPCPPRLEEFGFAVAGGV